MSTQTEITRINTARNTIRTKLVELGLATSTDKIDVLATTVESLSNNGAVTAEVKEGETYTIPKGYHNGSGTVSGVAGGGNYSLQSKTVTPTKSQQNITPDAGSYGLSDVTVEAIPENYQDVSSVDATAADVLANKKFVASDGTLIAGTMKNNGAVEKVLDFTGDTSYAIPAGYHNGNGKVSIVGDTKNVVPTKEDQAVYASAGKVLSVVTVSPIPSNYITTDDATAVAEQILEGATAYVNGELVDGTMVNNGSMKRTLNPVNAKQFVIPEGYHDGTGVVSVVPEEKSVAPTKEEQTVLASSGKSLSSVTVAAIPEAYQDVTSVDASAADVLTGKTIVAADGTVVEGTMPNNGEVSKTLDTATTSYTIPEGYHDGTGTVVITTEERSAVPTKQGVTVTPAAGKVLSKVTVFAIPDAYQDVTETTATAADVLAGEKFVNRGGEVITGAMANNGTINGSMDGLTVLSYSIPAGYTSGGTVSLTSDIEDALAAI